MSETTNTQQQPEVQENVQESVQENVQTFNPFSDNSWSEQRPDLSQPEQTTEQPEQATTTSSPDTQEYEEEIVDADEWLKREFNWESADAAKAEIGRAHV